MANVDVKRTQYYPAFSLTGSLGASSTALLEFLRNPMASVGAGLSLPFLEWRQMSVDIKIARSDYELRVLEFKQALYKAMADVDNALSLRTQLMAQEQHLQTALVLARKSERLNEIRYRQGAVSITFWLDAQNRRRLAELALDENRFDQYQNLAQIYLEFGGSPQ
ncbi:Probable efflux pump outer membrane protein ttgC precursor [Serratia plymuthica]|nr:Probable efflux pump outer membrane protein ttgC precursor [Serratia plymuthica]